VAVSDYPRLVTVANQELIKNDLHGYLAGHAGDGNLHPLIPYTPDDPDSYATSIAVQATIVEAAISMGGTATGEHGIGIGKRKFMALEHGNSLEVMRSIKNTLDPHGILNPGKIFMDDSQ
jgi:D-lactate dehydrogenase (cytochrome)